MQQFMDDFDAAGLIPASLLRWEMTGEDAQHLINMTNDGPSQEAFMVPHPAVAEHHAPVREGRISRLR